MSQAAGKLGERGARDAEIGFVFGRSGPPSAADPAGGGLPDGPLGEGTGPSAVVAVFPGAFGDVPHPAFGDCGRPVHRLFPLGPHTYLFLAYFVVPGFIEEGVKNRVLRKRTWYDPNFNYRFDGIVYGVFVSLGFAGVENVLYVLNAGFGTAVVRAIFSIPGHAMFGVVMGFYLSRAKWAEKYGQRHRMRADLRRSFFVPAVLHGLYDFLLMGFEAVFYFYFAGLVIGVICLLRKSAREDGPI